MEDARWWSRDEQAACRAALEVVSLAGYSFARIYDPKPWVVYTPGPSQSCEFHVEDPAKTERDRILAKLEALRPMEQPYTRRDWALEQKGERSMFEKILAAIKEGV